MDLILVPLFGEPTPRNWKASAASGQQALFQVSAAGRRSVEVSATEGETAGIKIRNGRLPGILWAICPHGA